MSPLNISDGEEHCRRQEQHVQRHEEMSDSRGKERSVPGELQTGEGGRRQSRVVTRACSEFCSKDERLRQQASGTAQEGCTLPAEGESGA